MKNLKRRAGFLNRHQNGLPNKKCTIQIVRNDIDGEHFEFCSWEPFDESKYTEIDMPAEGYLGTAITIEGIKIGFNVWEQNNSEFVYYAIV